MERIHVAVRARPLSPEDAKSSPWRIAGDSIHLSSNQSTKFEFDRIFGEECRTADVYAARTKGIVASAVRGFNGTVFAYGQTNSGKTYTMRGSAAEPGIIPLSVHDLFHSIQEDVDREFLVRMSYMEIYNEEINDLLAPEHRKLQIHENLERGIYVAGLREEIVTCPEQVLDLMEFGESHRHIGETNMNLYSSRSHTIFRMIVESREKVEDNDLGDSCDAVRVSVLNLVDLAGSERAAKTGAEGVRLKEGSHINKSLMTLGTVIKKLSEGAESQGGHVPYRDSKLTRILQPALGGNANTAIICNITLAQVHADETKSSLQFASRALRVTNCVCVNEILTDAALLKRQRKEIEELRAKLLSSHSEHWEEEILNLRNTLLQSELEKERIALELEEEKKAKAHRERRLQEQAKKIANLSSLVLYSERDEKAATLTKNKRRVTWCPGPSSNQLMDEVFTYDKVAMARESTGHERRRGLLPPFEKLMQENEIAEDDLSDKDTEDIFLPDVRSLLHVTNRRKINVNATDSFLENEQPVNQSEIVDQNLEDYDTQKKPGDFESEVSTIKLEFEHTPGRTISSISRKNGRKSLTMRESEAILVIKQLQDQIKSLEMEKASIQNSLDDVLELATKQNLSFNEKYDELHQEALKAHEEARLACEQLCSVAPEESYEELAAGPSTLLTEIDSVVLHVDQSRQTVDDVLSFVEELFQYFSNLSEMLLEQKSFACQDMIQLRSIISGHEKINDCMMKKINEAVLEKKFLHDQCVDYQNETQKLKSNLDYSEKAMAELNLQHDLEKDSICCQLLNLQKEVTSMSSSSLMKEKESLRKELDKTKSKLKETESKLKNSIQDKIKLESEKAQAEREIKLLHSQRAILERDIRKRESLIDKKRESKLPDFHKPKEHTGVVDQALQDDYEKLEVRAFEMEAEIGSLQDALISTIAEKEETIARNEFLCSELETFADKMSSADFEINSLKEEISMLMQKLAASESSVRSLEGSLNTSSKEKEEMALQLTDALLEMEAEKSTWLTKEKAFIEANERVKISNNEICRLSEDLREARRELESCREQCRALEERLMIYSENAEREKSCNALSSSEVPQQRNEHNTDESVERENSGCQSCMEVHDLREQLSVLAGERDRLSFQLMQMDTKLGLLNNYEDIQNQLLVMIRERDDLQSKNDQMNTAIEGAEILKKRYDDMLLKAKSDSDELSMKISSLEEKMHNDASNYNKERTKLRIRLSSTQQKMDTFRGRYEEAINEMSLMNQKYQEASAKLKKQLAAYGVEILSLKKQLSDQRIVLGACASEKKDP
ncbi:kinesin-like protein KIN-7I isoform X2 [Ananas comosus]|uniref:Kinesin-like protein KIN-7I isoform X2 n=1 Tax=Ananas comosus TaxID=4615 RepID=A0A6P5GXF6_ANACO|nr:kinesin-like protein KIN-7I isoform X2 [Ananas comosus]